MPTKPREKSKSVGKGRARKVRLKSAGGKGGKIKIKYLVAALALVGSVLPRLSVQAESCPDVRVIFARGSGGERWTDPNYLEYKNTIESKLSTTALKYEFIDLDYPAVGVGADNIGVTLGGVFRRGGCV